MTRMTLSGVPLEPWEDFPPDPSPDPNCRMCNWPWDDGWYCERCQSTIRQPEEDDGS